MDIGLFLNIVTVLEVIIVEAASVWLLSRKKHSFAIFASIYAAITLALLLFMCLVAVRLPGYGNGNGRFFVLGVFYFIPALVNFSGDWRSRIIIAFYSFSYGLAGFCLAVRIGYLFETAHMDIVVLTVQTLLYAATFPFFLRFSKKQVVTSIQQANDKQKGLLIRLTIISFLLVIAYNRIMVEGATGLKYLLVYLFLLYFVLLTYRLIVSYLQVDKDNQNLNTLVKIDRLTQLGNRLALRDALNRWQEEEGEFYLLFLDLNHFKSINDSFGHDAGDRYLQAFALELKKTVAAAAECFRLAGDEFICLTHAQQLPEQIKALRPPITSEAGVDIPYLGVSVGAVRYPAETNSISALLKLADERMYEDKRQIQHTP